MNIKDVSQSTNLYEIAEVIQQLNPNAEIRVANMEFDPQATTRFYSSVPMDKLVLPNGFYYNEKNGITNKHNTQSGFYCALEVEDLSMADERTLLPKKERVQEQTQQTLDPNQELVKMAKEQRKFTILQRERAMNNEQKAKNRSALLAGACLIGACVAVYFNGADVHQVLQHELNAIYSWQGLGQYLADLGPFTTMMAAGVGAFTAKYFKHSKKFKDAQNQFIDMNNSLMQENVQEFGGQENAKSR